MGWLAAGAVALMLPELLSMAWGRWRPRDGRRPEETAPGRLFRRIDVLTGCRTRPLGWLAFDVLLGLGVAWAWIHTAAPWATLASLGAAGLMWLLVFPALVLVDLVVWPFCEPSPVHASPARHFPEHAELQAAWAAIRDELRRVEGRLPRVPEMVDVLPDNGLPRNVAGGAPTWNLLLVRVGHRTLSPNARHLPVLAPLLERASVVNAMFSTLNPGVELVPHRGYTRLVVRYHLTLDEGEAGRAWLEVGGERYEWRDGHGVLFDDMFVHAARNHGARRRTVLFLDIRRRLPGPLDWLSRLCVGAISYHPFGRDLQRRGRRWAQALESVHG